MSTSFTAKKRQHNARKNNTTTASSTKHIVGTFGYENNINESSSMNIIFLCAIIHFCVSAIRGFVRAYRHPAIRFCNDKKSDSLADKKALKIESTPLTPHPLRRITTRLEHIPLTASSTFLPRQCAAASGKKNLAQIWQNFTQLHSIPLKMLFEAKKTQKQQF